MTNFNIYVPNLFTVNNPKLNMDIEKLKNELINYVDISSSRKLKINK